MSRSEIIRYIILRSIGNFLLLFAIFGVIATFGPALFFELQYRIASAQGVKYSVMEEPKTSPLGEVIERNNLRDSSNTSGFAAVLSGNKDQVLIPKDTDFSLLIPKIGASAKIIPNVDPSNEKEFLPALQNGVAHAKGTVFPGMKGVDYLFAHSTDNFWDVGRYNAIFYLLKDLQKGDDIVVFFEGRRHNYKVVDTKIVDPSDVSYLIDGQNKEKEELVLQTCWPPGTTWKRLLVISEPNDSL